MSGLTEQKRRICDAYKKAKSELDVGAIPFENLMFISIILLLTKKKEKKLKRQVSANCISYSSIKNRTRTNKISNISLRRRF